MRLVSHGGFAGATRGSTHVGQHDAASLGLKRLGDLGELVIGVVDAVVGGGVQVQDERAHDDGRVGAPREQVLHHQAHPVAHGIGGVVGEGRLGGAGGRGLVHVVVLHAVVGADVEEDDVGEVTGDACRGLLEDLVDPVSRPPLHGVFGHGAVVAAADICHLAVASVLEKGEQVLPVAIPVGGEEAVCDGGP